MRRIRYAVAASLDGFIAGPKGEADWITIDPEIDFAAFYKEFDTVLMGRRSFATAGGAGWGFGMKTIVVSRTLRQQDHPDVTIIRDRVKENLTALRGEPGKDIWLFGGGVLFGSLLEMGLIDTVEIALIPVLLGEGVPLFHSPFRQVRLKLARHKVYKSGTIALDYEVLPISSARANRKAKPAASAKKKPSRRAAHSSPSAR